MDLCAGCKRTVPIPPGEVSSTVPYGWHLLPADDAIDKPYWLCPQCWASRKAEASSARIAGMQSGVIAPHANPKKR